MSAAPVSDPAVVPPAPALLTNTESAIIYDPNVLLKMDTNQLLLQLVCRSDREFPKKEAQIRQLEIQQLATDWIMEKVAMFKAEGLNDFADKLLGLI